MKLTIALLLATFVAADSPAQVLIPVAHHKTRKAKKHHGPKHKA